MASALPPEVMKLWIIYTALRVFDLLANKKAAMDYL